MIRILLLLTLIRSGALAIPCAHLFRIDGPRKMKSLINSVNVSGVNSPDAYFDPESGSSIVLVKTFGRPRSSRFMDDLPDSPINDLILPDRVLSYRTIASNVTTISVKTSVFFSPFIWFTSSALASMGIFDLPYYGNDPGAPLKDFGRFAVGQLVTTGAALVTSQFTDSVESPYRELSPEERLAKIDQQLRGFFKHHKYRHSRHLLFVHNEDRLPKTIADKIAPMSKTTLEDLLAVHEEDAKKLPPHVETILKKHQGINFHPNYRSGVKGFHFKKISADDKDAIEQIRTFFDFKFIPTTIEQTIRDAEGVYELRASEVLTGYLAMDDRDDGSFQLRLMIRDYSGNIEWLFEGLKTMGFSPGSIEDIRQKVASSLTPSE